MFSGLVEEVATIQNVSLAGAGRAFTVRAGIVLDGLRLGDSVSIDGACHTVTAIHFDSFEVQSIATTLQRTTLAEFESGRRVNLERALSFGDRLGGHLVQGHVDGVGEVVSIARHDGHVLIDFTVPPLVEDVTIQHGSITLNGVSLTVNAIPRPGIAQVSIIPHTWQVTNFSDLREGSRVNLEGDMIGKYVRQLVLQRQGPGSS